MNKAVFITGAAIRLGKAFALAFAKQNFDVALHFNASKNEALETKAEIESFGVKCILVPFDLSKVDQIKTGIDLAFEQLPHINVLVNSASYYVQSTIETTAIADYEKLFDVNIKAPFFLTQFFASHCKNGNIINIIDNKVAFNQFTYAAYLLTKKSLAEFTKMAAIEYAPNIRVNGVSPGVVLPASSRSAQYIDWRVKGIPLQMQGGVEHITDAIFSLIDNRFITGQIITVDGGESISNVGRNAGDFDQILI